MADPLAPLRADPTYRRKKPERDARTVMRQTAYAIGAGTVLAFALGSTPLVIIAAVVWAGWAIYYVLLVRVLDPRGEDTPYVNQHSNIQAMVMQGRYEQAAAAYREAVAADPLDLVACEQLGRLAIQELKDYPAAVSAYREAERRTTEPRRRVGYALQVAAIYRDNLRDPGRTVVELRRILASYPDVPNAAALRAEIEELKARHLEGT